jgi:hypothetical protein
VSSIVPRDLDVGKEDLARAHLDPDHTGIVTRYLHDLPPRRVESAVEMPILRSFIPAELSLDRLTQRFMMQLAEPVSVQLGRGAQGVFDLAGNTW